MPRVEARRVCVCATVRESFGLLSDQFATTMALRSGTHESPATWATVLTALMEEIHACTAHRWAIDF